MGWGRAAPSATWSRGALGRPCSISPRSSAPRAPPGCANLPAGSASSSERAERNWHDRREPRPSRGTRASAAAAGLRVQLAGCRERRPVTGRPSLLFYCQHSLGMGHLVRSMALAAALAERFRVVFLNGGPLPRRFPVPPGVEVVALPPLGMDEQSQLVSRDRRRSVERAQQLRRERILSTYRDVRPSAGVGELFRFGRKKLAGELLPLLEL